MQKESVVVEEINMYEDMPNRHVQDLIMQLYTEISQLGGILPVKKRKIL